MVFFVPLLDVLAKELVFLMPKIIQKAAKESSLNILSFGCSKAKWLSNIKRNVKD